MTARLYLHLPIHKTGSTALQNRLWAAEPKLAKVGMTYLPKYTSDCQHAVLCRKQGEELQTLLQGMRSAAAGKDIILSTEQLHIGSDLAIANFVQAIRKAFSDHAITTVVYLRRQDDAFSSFYNQIVKFGVETGSTAEVFRRYAPFFDFERYLGLLGRGQGPEDKLIVRLYQREKLVGQDIGKDFMSAIGMDFDLPAAATQSVNPSLERSVFALKRAMNTELQGAPAPLLQALAGVLADASAGLNGGNPDTNILTDLERDLILEHFEPSNRRVSETYLGGARIAEARQASNPQGSRLEDVLPAVLARMCRYFYHINTLP